MRKIIVPEPVTLFSKDRNIKVLDGKRNLFYFHPNEEGKINFNLPQGTYYTQNNFEQKIFKPYKEFGFYNFSISPKEIKVIYKPNPHKATITPELRQIVIDPKFANHDFQPVKAFILGHEYGHLVHGGNKFDFDGNITFNAESECDKFASDWMLANGYNPTQVEAAVQLSLSDPYRKKCIHSHSIKESYRR